MSVPHDLLAEDGRKQLAGFYSEVFGWEVLDVMTEDRNRYVFGCHTVEQFVFLHGEEQPMACPRLDHYGFSVGTEVELDAILAKARSYKERDDRVDIVEKFTEDYGPLSITAIYVGYLLPMMAEIQWWEYK